MTCRVIAVTAPEHAELLSVDVPDTLGSSEIRGPTVATLVSPGTELGHYYLQSSAMHRSYPCYPGYAAVFRAEDLGRNVRDMQRGDLLFCTGNHQSTQKHAASEVLPVPPDLAPENALVTRLLEVTITALSTTTARPGEPVVVSGAGPVGYLGAHLFASAGYNVHVIEPDASRRAYLKRTGIETVYAAPPHDNERIAGKAALLLECSGREQAVLDGLQLIRKKGEVVLIGMPWQRHSDASARDLICAVFSRCAVMRSGWERQLPWHAAHAGDPSIFDGYRLGLRWLAQGRIPLDDLVVKHDPVHPQDSYQSLRHNTADGLFHVFDWTTLTAGNAA